MMFFNRKKTDIKKIIIHCSASDAPEHDSVDVIRDWHLHNGWKDIGYHWVITKDGVIHKGRSELIMGAHCVRHNNDSIGVCLTGRQSFKQEQFKAAKKLCYEIMKRYGISITDIYPHSFFTDLKTCPNFPISKIFETI